MILTIQVKILITVLVMATQLLKVVPLEIAQLLADQLLKVVKLNHQLLKVANLMNKVVKLNNLQPLPNHQQILKIILVIQAMVEMKIMPTETKVTNI